MIGNHCHRAVVRLGRELLRLSGLLSGQRNTGKELKQGSGPPRRLEKTFIESTAIDRAEPREGQTFKSAIATLRPDGTVIWVGEGWVGTHLDEEKARGGCRMGVRERGGMDNRL